MELLADTILTLRTLQLHLYSPGVGQSKRGVGWMVAGSICLIISNFLMALATTCHHSFLSLVQLWPPDTASLHHAADGPMLTSPLFSLRANQEVAQGLLFSIVNSHSLGSPTECGSFYGYGQSLQTAVDHIMCGTCKYEQQASLPFSSEFVNKRPVTVNISPIRVLLSPVAAGSYALHESSRL